VKRLDRRRTTPEAESTFGTTVLPVRGAQEQILERHAPMKKEGARFTSGNLVPPIAGAAPLARENPGNADLPISGQTEAAIRENRVPGASRWHSRGYLPHFDSPDAIQHVTFHLGDSLPQAVLQRLDNELQSWAADKRDLERRKWIDAWMDAGHGSCVLAKSAIADMVQAALLNFDAQRYRMMAWVVMPNHVHTLFQPIDGWSVATIVAAWKKFTARKISDDRRDQGEDVIAPVWHPEYWDRYVRNQRHLDQTVEYIHMNPVKAGLVASPEEWPRSSARFRAIPEKPLP